MKLSVETKAKPRSGKEMLTTGKSENNFWQV
jgi:hypothetical protein